METYLVSCTSVESNKHKKALLKLLREEPVIAFDTETTGLKLYSVDVPIGVGIYFPKADEGYYIIDVISGLAFLVSCLQNLKTRIVIGHNIAFDILAIRTLCRKKKIPCDFFVDVVDTMIFAKLIDNNTKTLSLNDISELFGFATRYQKEMSEWLFMNGYGDKHVVSAAPIELQKNYCIEDCVLTYKIYERFCK